MRKIEISIEISVSNGEWADGRKISKDWSAAHTIDLCLLNDENTFQSVKAVWEREFKDAMDKAVNQVMQRMIDNKPDKPVPGSASDEVGKKE